MKQYTAISKEIASFKGNSKLSDIYTYACLYSTIDYKTGESKCNQDTIEKKFGIPTRTFSDTIKRLSDYKIISIRTKFYKPNNTIIRKNYYSMKIDFENYFFIWNDFFAIDASRELKGFLLLLKAHCLNGTNTYFAKKLYKGKPNKQELIDLLGIDRKTLNFYLNEAIDKKFICIDGDKIILLNENFRLLINTEKRESEVRDVIQELANKFNLSIPIVTDKEINRIIWKYPISEDELLSIKDEKFWKKYSFKYTLFRRIKKRPRELNIRYIFKVLNIDYSDEEDKTEYNGISIN